MGRNHKDAVKGGQQDLLVWGDTVAKEIETATDMLLSAEQGYNREISIARQDKRKGTSSALNNAQGHLYHAQQTLRQTLDAAHGARSSEARSGQKALATTYSVDKPR